MPQTLPTCLIALRQGPVYPRAWRCFWLLGLPGVVALAWTTPPAWLAALEWRLRHCGRLGRDGGLSVLLALSVGLGVRLGPRLEPGKRTIDSYRG